MEERSAAARRCRRPSPSIKMDEQLVSTFMEVTSCESQADAVQHLGSCRWDLDEAINLYFRNAGGSTTKPPSGSSADPILLDEDVPTKEDNGHGDAIDGDYEDDVGDPPYYGYGNRSTALDAPSVVETPCPALSEIVPTGWGEEIAPTGWGEAEPNDAGEAGVENVDGSQEAHDDDAEQDDNISTKEEDDGGSMHSSNGERYGEFSNGEDSDRMMSYSEDDDDDDDAYYSSVAAEETEGDRPVVQPPQRPQRPPKESLRELFRPPYELMYRGSFHSAKVHAARWDRFLLVNLQTSHGAGDFPSQMQNRDLWADELANKVVVDSFVFFWLRKEDSDSLLDEGKKLAGFYKLEDDQLPAVLVVDPITGQLLAKRSGTMMPDEFMQFVDEYTKSKPSALSMPKFVEKTPVLSPSVGAGGEQELAWASYAAAVEQGPPAVSESPAPPADDEVGEQERGIIPINNSAAAGGAACSEQEHVPVPDTTDESPAEMLVDVDDDEPMEDEEMYKLRIRFPDGTMVAKEFGCKRRVASLFAFCRSALHGGGQQHAEEEKKAIRIMRFAGRALEAIQDDDAGATFEDLGLNFAAVSVVFDA